MGWQMGGRPNLLGYLGCEMMEMVLEIGAFTREGSQAQCCISISFLASQKPMFLWVNNRVYSLRNFGAENS
jgi:hypothetical protein